MLSPRLAPRFHARGHAAEHVAHRGLGGSADPAVWAHAFANDQIVLTINARDFLELARTSSLHAGLIILRSHGLSSEEQWQWLLPSIAYLEQREDGYLVNRVLEVIGPEPDGFIDRAIPP
jgi:predicted nuclease of predicted toxin-antitoxin system